MISEFEQLEKILENRIRASPEIKFDWNEDGALEVYIPVSPESGFCTTFHTLEDSGWIEVVTSASPKLTFKPGKRQTFLENLNRLGCNNPCKNLRITDECEVIYSLVTPPDTSAKMLMNIMDFEHGYLKREIIGELGAINDGKAPESEKLLVDKSTGEKYLVSDKEDVMYG